VICGHYDIIPTAPVTSRAKWTANLSLKSKSIYFAISDPWEYQLAGSSTALHLYNTVHCELVWQWSCLMTGISEGMETTGKLHQIDVTENSLFYCSPVTLCSTTALTLISYPLTWHPRKIGVDNVLSCFFNHALPKFKFRPLTPNFSVEANRPKLTAPQM